jgi:hypothetical protein
VIQVGAVPYDLAELLERIAPFRPPRFVRCKVAGNHVRPCRIKVRVNSNLTKILPARQVTARVNLRRGLAEIGVEARGVVEVRRNSGVVAPVAIRDRVDRKLPSPTKSLSFSAYERLERRGGITRELAEKALRDGILQRNRHVAHALDAPHQC